MDLVDSPRNVKVLFIFLTLLSDPNQQGDLKSKVLSGKTGDEK